MKKNKEFTLVDILIWLIIFCEKLLYNRFDTEKIKFKLAWLVVSTHNLNVSETFNPTASQTLNVTKP